MRCVSTFLVFLFFLSLAPAGRAQSAASVPSPPAPFGEKISVRGIHNAGKVSENLFRGAQPLLSSLAELKKLGITTIVDLRAESRRLRDRERLHAESLGIRFVPFPLGGFATPTNAQLAAFLTLLRETPPQKIFVHCQYGEDRTGIFIAAYRIAINHWSPDRALSEMLAFGFNYDWHPSMVAFVRSLPDRLISDPILKSALAN